MIALFFARLSFCYLALEMHERAPHAQYAYICCTNALLCDQGTGDDDNGGLGGTSGSTKHDDEDEFERWIGCNHRLIYHYDHYVTARENIFLPCTIRGVRLMKVYEKITSLAQK